MLSIIVAMSENGVIGRDGDLPWRLPDDLRRFKRLTTGHAVIMGRKTYASLPGALPDRRMIVLSRDPSFTAENAEVVARLDDAIALAADDDEPFVIGGAAVYERALPRADRLYLTLVHAEIEGDVRFPPLDLKAWTVIEQEHHAADDRHAHAFSFHTYDRVIATAPNRS